MENKDITYLVAPLYRSDITDDIITVTFKNNAGKSAKIYSQKQSNVNINGTKELVSIAKIDDGIGSFEFPACEFPLGPISIRVDVYDTYEAADDSQPIDSAYFQFFNYAGVDWNGGIGKAPVNHVIEGMKLSFAENFNAMPILTTTGLNMGKTGNLTNNLDAPRSYATRKVDNTGGTSGGMFGWAFFSDYIADENDPRQKYNPFKHVSDRNDGNGNKYMRINTAYWEDAHDGVGMEISGERYWGQKATTGYLSSMGMDGSGFFTQGGRNQYFETRMFFGPNPAHWPAFWLLTANGGYLSTSDENGNTPWGAPAWGDGGSDEIDIIEAYLGNPESYQIAWHEWGYSSGKGGGTWVNLSQELFRNINIAEGFHILAVLITENITYYYCDNILVFEHETLKYSWELGNYFIINGGISDHFGLPKAEDDTFGAKHHLTGFTKYGNECYDYIDWIRVWEDEPNTPRFDTALPLNADDGVPKFSLVETAFESSVQGEIIEIEIERNMASSSIYGTYTVKFPDYAEFGEHGYKVINANAGVNRQRETITIQLPSHKDWENKFDSILITPPGSGSKTLTVTVKSP